MKRKLVEALYFERQKAVSKRLPPQRLRQNELIAEFTSTATS